MIVVDFFSLTLKTAIGNKNSKNCLNVFYENNTRMNEEEVRKEGKDFGFMTSSLIV